METLTIHRAGQGPAVMLVHGGAGPTTTWRGLESLAARWTLLYVYRRGFGAGPLPPHGHQDFEVDADDLEVLCKEYRPHVVAHSYGVLGTLLATARVPECVRSLTLIEPPLYFLAPDDPDVARLQQVGDAVLTEGLATDPAILREFLTLSGAPAAGPGGASEAAVRRALGGRLPGEARPDLKIVRAAGIPALVASGGHHPALERICDRLAAELAAQRLLARGAGHFVPAAPGFAAALEEFLGTR